MEKQRNESKPETLVLENESTETPEIRHENAENSDSFPPQNETSPPETNQIEATEEPAPPAENQQDGQESDNVRRPSTAIPHSRA